MNLRPCFTRGCYNIPDEQGETVQGLETPLRNCNKLDVNNWLDNLPGNPSDSENIEIRFKNTRKGFYKNINKLNLKKGDIVAVEASPGHDIGVVSLTGILVKEQMKHARVREDEELKKVYRKAKAADIEKWLEAIGLEETTMLKSRKIASSLNLDMKIGDVEYQGDRTKAIFYYYAEDRVDFRELIKILAEEFKIRVEMKQIGARQEAARIGGIGTCGRELCCTNWITDFVSVTTNSARYQEVALNPQKLAGQCGKLKCCLNYELKTYLDAREDFPNTDQVLETVKGSLFHQKTDVFRRLMWYAYKKESASEFVLLTVDKVKEIIAQNRSGQKSEEIKETVIAAKEQDTLDYENVVGQESLTRFEDKEKKNRQQSRHRHNPRHPGQSPNQNRNPKHDRRDDKKR